MFSIVCPQCSVKLRADESLKGRRIRCPKCKQAIRIAEPSPPPPEVESEEFPEWLAALCGLAVVTIAGIFLASILGPFRTFVLCFVLVATILASWQRKRLTQLVAAGLESLSASLKHRKSAPSAAATGRRSSTAPSSRKASSPVPAPSLGSAKRAAISGTSLGHAQSRSDGLKEIQAATEALTTPIGHRSLYRPQADNQSPTSLGNRLANWLQGPSTQDVRFIGPGDAVRISGHALHGPLLYFVEGQLPDPFDASLIETGLPVASGTRGAGQLPYWPSYRECSPQQRRAFLDWLTGGRSNPYAELGYVFIYFYGLERRVLVDRADHAAVVQEVLRLLSIYRHSRSFHRYAAHLLWMALLTADDVQVWSEEVIEQVMQSTAYWNDEHIAAMLGLYAMREQPLPAAAAYLVAQHDSRSPRSVIIQRHPDHFRNLFNVRYLDQYGDGMPLRTAKRSYLLRHRPASGTLPAADISFPNVPGISSQFKSLVKLWSSAIDDLRVYDRAHRKEDSQKLTAAMYESLPPDLREDDHPDFEQWHQIMDRFTDDAGWTFVPVGDLAATRGIEHRRKLTKTQSHDLLRAADCMQLCIEPDARETGQSYGWTELVSVFPREGHEQENLQSYHAASILLRLGMTVAAADGEIDSDEVAVIEEHLNQQFELSPQESIRLEHLGNLLSRSPIDDGRLARQLKKLTRPQRIAVGDFLVCIAAADEIITPDELKALKKAFRNLDLDPGQIEQLAAGHVQTADEPADSRENDELVLDPERIRRIMAETASVATLLQEVMLDEDEPASAVSVVSHAAEPDASLQPETEVQTGGAGTAIAEADDRFENLQVRYHEFLRVLLTQDCWARDEFETLARTHRLMASGAVEAVNEWALDQLGDWLIEDTEESIAVNCGLLPGTGDG